MLRLILALMALSATTLPLAAQTPMQRCKSVADSLERLKCYDAIEPAAQPTSAQPAQPAAAATAEDPLITQAKAAVKTQLRDADSARFQNVKIRTSAGKQTVCGFVTAKNTLGITPPMQPFGYDGEQAHLIIYNPGPANITSMDAKALGNAMNNRIKAYNRLCK
jgi:hypothetical protein